MKHIDWFKKCIILPTVSLHRTSFWIIVKLYLLSVLLVVCPIRYIMGRCSFSGSSRFPSSMFSWACLAPWLAAVIRQNSLSLSLGECTQRDAGEDHLTSFLCLIEHCIATKSLRWNRQSTTRKKSDQNWQQQRQGQLDRHAHPCLLAIPAAITVI